MDELSVTPSRLSDYDVRGTGTPDSQSGSSGSQQERLIIILAAGFLLFSGIASLTYEVTWVRLLGLSFGSTSASISTVLAAFFLGMALGNAMAVRINRLSVDSFKRYLWLEIGIAISGLVLLPILLHLDGLVALVPAFGTSVGLKFGLAFLLLSVPTICMGATFPVLTAILVRREEDVGWQLGQLYSLNVAGAVLGALLSGFVFIPRWGLDGAVFIAVTLNLAIVFVGFYFNRRINWPTLDGVHAAVEQATQTTGAHFAPSRRRVIIVLFATGLTAIGSQVGWTKYLALFTGTTIYGFAAILTVVLLGMTLGAWVMRSQLRHLRSPHLVLTTLLVLLAASLLATHAGLTWVPALYRVVNALEISPVMYHGIKYGIVFGLLLFPSLVFGALFPLNLHLYCGDVAGVRARLGTAYAVNSVAGVLGALMAGFWLIPAFGTDVLLILMMLAIAALSIPFILAVEATRPRALLMVGLVMLLFAAWQRPQLDYEALIASVGYQYDDDVKAGREAEFLFLKEGKAGIVSLVTYDDVYAKLQINGINESVLHMKDPNKALLVESLLGLVPYMLHERPENAFVVGFGGGITTRALSLTDLKTIRVVELEPAIVEAGRVLSGGEIPVLADARVALDFNDARNTLVTESDTYDLILSQPSHPWLAGAAGLYTEQFWQIAKGRLNEDGIMGQWINLFKMDAMTLGSVFQAFYGVFPHGMSLAIPSTGDLLLIGSLEPLRIDPARMDRILAQPAIRATLGPHGLKTHRELLWYFAMSRRDALAAAGDTVPNTDTNLLSEVRLAALRSNPVGENDPYALLKQNTKLDLVPFLDPDMAADWLSAQADFYLGSKSYARAEMAATQLMTLNPVLGRAVAHERLYRLGKREAAFEMYAGEQEWPSRTHLLQALALVDLGRNYEAWGAIGRITDANEFERSSNALRKKLGDGKPLDLRADDPASPPR